MSEQEKTVSEHHFVKKEPKFCRCKLCHERFYAQTLDEARRACEAHAGSEHPGWERSASYCPE